MIEPNYVDLVLERVLEHMSSFGVAVLRLLEEQEDKHDD